MPHLRSPARFSMYCFYQLLVRSWLPRGLQAGTSADFVQFLGGVDCLCRFCSRRPDPCTLNSLAHQHIASCAGPAATLSWQRRRVHPRRRSRRATALIAGNNLAGPISRLPRSCTSFPSARGRVARRLGGYSEDSCGWGAHIESNPKSVLECTGAPPPGRVAPARFSGDCVSRGRGRRPRAGRSGGAPLRSL